MDTVVIEHVDQISIKENNIPNINDGEILIKVKMAGICGSDIHTYKGLHPFRKPPVVIGHEVSGEVAAIASDVSDFKIGDKVTVEPQMGCGKCEYCHDGFENLCISRQAPGIGEWAGTMAEYFKAPSSRVIKLPEATSHETGVLAEPLAVAIHAVNKAEVQPNEKVAVLGAGSIGLLTLAVAWDRGVEHLLITDVLDHPLKVGRLLGAKYTLNVTEHTDWEQVALTNAEGPFDKVIVANSGDKIINEALNITKKAGKIVTVAMFQNDHSVNIPNLQNTEKEIVGCMTYNREDFREAIRFIQKDHIPINKVISHILPYNEASQAFQIVDKKEDESSKVLLHF